MLSVVRKISLDSLALRSVQVAALESSSVLVSLSVSENVTSEHFTPRANNAQSKPKL